MMIIAMSEKTGESGGELEAGQGRRGWEGDVEGVLCVVVMAKGEGNGRVGIPECR